MAKEDHMIGLLIIYHCKPGMRDAFYQEIVKRRVGAAAKAEPGNVHYEYYLPAEAADDLLLFEGWKDQAALDYHKTTQSFKDLQELKKNT